ncbi:14266_t:CDS:2 [Acaulospora colombiana]|uniref:14266_t:CDS:1 n=1 Tax=Acaulospora colombiana TaxID=27376 RepID=A0ACA9K3F2_9GLOM|nr:14266_t:CDS:2 [Acaulospora colombiana]
MEFSPEVLEVLSDTISVITSQDLILTREESSQIRYQHLSSIIDAMGEASTKYSPILEEHDTYDIGNAGVKRFEGVTLAYATISQKSSKGNLTSEYTLGIDYRAQANQYELSGGHDVDQDWIKEVRVNVSGKTRGKIVPRFQLHNWNQMDYQYMINDEVHSLVNVLSTECRNRGFDGMVLEGWYPGLLRDFIRNLGNELHKFSRELILVLSPRNSLTAAQYEDFSQFVDFFSVMTYDYSQQNTPGPNAPIRWVEDTIVSFTPTPIDRGKLLLGLNMYGVDFSNGQMEFIVGSTIIKKLKQHKPRMRWDKIFEEHRFQYQENGISHEVCPSSLDSIWLKITAQDYHSGRSVRD